MYIQGRAGMNQLKLWMFLICFALEFVVWVEPVLGDPKFLESARVAEKKISDEQKHFLQRIVACFI